MTARFAAAFCLSLLPAGVVRPAAAEVELVRSGDAIRIVADGELRAVMQTSERFAKPFLYPVLQPGWSQSESESDADSVEVLDPGLTDGQAVPVSALAVRQMATGDKRPEGYDHPHHRGIWIAVDEVAGTTFWSEGGVIDVVSADILQSQGNPAVLRLNTRWLANSTNDTLEDDRVVLKQSTLWSFYDDGFIGTKTIFSAPVGGSVTFGDTKEGLLGIRVPDDSREESGGLIRSSDGTTGEGNVWGREWAWVDYAAPADQPESDRDRDSGSGSDARRGVTLYDHPSNFRLSRYHVRGYGLFAINPFGPAAYTDGEQPADPVTTAGFNNVTLQYGIWIHSDATPEQIAERGQQFIDATTGNE